MADGQINFFLDSVDDPLLPDQIPSFDGGQFSNLRANLLQPNQSKLLGNCDIDKLGKLRTRRGTVLIGPDADPRPDPSAADTGTPIQGLTSYQTADANYIVAAHNGKLWAWDDPLWVQIGLGGTADEEEIFIARVGKINNANDPDTGYSYPVGSTVLTVDGVTGVIGAGEKLYFTTNLRRDYYEYTVASTVGGATPTQITLEEPGLVFAIKDNWDFTVLRPAAVNHPTPGNRYAGGTTTIAIDGYTGVVNDGEKFVIGSENITHTVSAGGHSETGGNTTGLTFTPALQANWAAGSVTAEVTFAQGDDSLFFTDGTGAIYGWKGAIPTSSTVGGGTLMKIGSHSLLDNLSGSFVQEQTEPPEDVRILLWFQNRLIASGIAEEPDAIYFSDFFDPSSWDRNYQKVRIGGGESDPITGLHAWTDLNMLVFKKNSIYIVNCDPSQNPNPSDPTLLVASFSVKQIHKRIGCPAPLTAIQVGGGSTTPGSDVFFMDGDKKIHSIRRVLAAETQQEVGTAISLPVQDILDTTNINYIDKACAWYHNEHYLLGFPSTRGEGGGTLPNGVMTYNLLTQSWCGVWGWSPTCFAMRTDLGAYSKLIFGDGDGNVVQWMDDLSLDEETETTYEDKVPMGSGNGNPIITSITTRAITFGDAYSFKTGLSVEFEFDESVAADVVVKVVLDKVIQGELIASPFNTLSEPRLRLPQTLPFTLPASPDLLRKAFDLQRYGTWRELQFYIQTTAGKLALRSIRVTGWIDTIRLQTLPSTGIPALGVPASPTGGGP